MKTGRCRFNDPLDERRQLYATAAVAGDTSQATTQETCGENCRWPEKGADRKESACDWQRLHGYLLKTHGRRSSLLIYGGFGAKCIPDPFLPGGQLSDVCMSGGADGADLVWGAEARRHGHKVLHFSFAGHRTQAPPDELAILSDDDLGRADPYLAKASARLKRHWPPASKHAANLLRRDWYQVKDAERVYAVARLQENRQIEGGTAWTAALFIDRHDGRPCEAYLFAPNRRQWFRWNADWEATAMPPPPSGLWAGIGTRALSPSGEAAIRALFDS